MKWWWILVVAYLWGCAPRPYYRQSTTVYTMMNDRQHCAVTFETVTRVKPRAWPAE